MKPNILKCPICEKSRISSIYRGPIRFGSWGSWTKESHNVFSCEDCALVFLENTHIDPKYYQSEEYRKAYNDDASIKNVLGKSRKSDRVHFDRIGPEFFEGKVVADVGAGVGGFIDIVKPLAKKTIAVEPAEAYHSYLSQSHDVYPYANDLVRSGRKVDVVTSFNVIEHVSHPLQFVRDMRECLNQNGKLILVTPNFDDILNKLIFEDFSRYFFRTAHLFYFCRESIIALLSNLEINNISVEFIHNYSLDNMINWLRTRQLGNDKNILFDTSAMDDIYIKEVENQGLSSHLLIRCSL